MHKMMCRELDEKIQACRKIIVKGNSKILYCKACPKRMDLHYLGKRMKLIFDIEMAKGEYELW